MNALGWSVWVMVLILVVITIGDIRKGGVNRRVGLLFDAIAIPLLLLTALTHFSKFHLLWIIPIAMGCSFAAMVWWPYKEAVSMENSMVRAIREAAAKIPPLSLPPFGTIRWDGIETWEGEVILPAWVGFQSRGGAYGAENSEDVSDGTARMSITPTTATSPPTEAQRRALQLHIDRGGEIVQSVLSALPQYYKKLRKNWEDDLPDMPAVPQHPEAFKKLIELRQVHIHPFEKDGIAYVGLQFGCDWDEEHGLGIVLHGAQIVDIGAADESFSWQPDETSTKAEYRDRLQTSSPI